MSFNEILSILFVIFLIPALAYLGFNCIRFGYKGIIDRKIKVWTEGNSRKSTSTYKGIKAIIIGIISIFIGITLFSFVGKLIYSLLNELFYI